MACKERASHVKSFLPIVVSVVLLNPTEVRSQELVDHVAKEESFPLNIVGSGGHMRKKLTLKEKLCVLDTVLLDESLGTTSLCNVI